MINWSAPVYTSGGLALNTEGVEKYISDFEAIYETAAQTDGEYLQKRIDRLEDLKNTVLTQEQIFFNKLGFKSNDMRENLTNLQEKLDQIFNESGIDQLLDLNFYNVFLRDPNILAALKTHSQAAIIAMINASSKDLLADTADLTSREEVITQLNKTLLNINSQSTANTSNLPGIPLKKGQRFMIYKNQKYKNNRGIVKFINEINGEWQIEIKADSNIRLDPGIKDKLLTIISKNVTNATLQSDIKIFRDYINAKIESYLTGQFKTLAQEQFNKYQDNYFLNFSENSLKGYIEEICVNIVFSSLGFGSSIPMGNIKEILSKRGRSGADLFTDMLFRNQGFQIKSWILQDGKHIDRVDNKEAGTFITNRLEYSMNSLLVKLFGTYQFNQKYDDAYEDTQNKLNELMDPEGIIMNNVFASNLDKILRIDRTFEATSVLTKFGQYYNTFFMINNRLVPSSQILQTIIDALYQIKNSAYSSDIISFKITKIQNTKNVNTLGQLIETNERINQRYHMNILEMANLVKLSYILVFDVDALFKQAYKNLKN